MYSVWARELAIRQSQKARRNALKLGRHLGKLVSGPTISRLLIDLIVIGSVAAILAFLRVLFKSELPGKLWKRYRASYSMTVCRLQRAKFSIMSYLLSLLMKDSN